MLRQKVLRFEGYHLPLLELQYMLERDIFQFVYFSENISNRGFCVDDDNWEQILSRMLVATNPRKLAYKMFIFI